MADKKKQGQSPSEAKPEKGKPKKGAAEAKPEKKEAEALLQENPGQLVERLKPLRSLTTYSVAQALGVKASVANALLRRLVEMGLAERVGGYSGHYVYALKGAGG